MDRAARSTPTLMRHVLSGYRQPARGGRVWRRARRKHQTLRRSASRARSAEPRNTQKEREGETESRFESGKAVQGPERASPDAEGTFCYGSL